METVKAFILTDECRQRRGGALKLLQRPDLRGVGGRADAQLAGGDRPLGVALEPEPVYPSGDVRCA